MAAEGSSERLSGTFSAANDGEANSSRSLMHIEKKQKDVEAARAGEEYEARNMDAEDSEYEGNDKFLSDLPHVLIAQISSYLSPTDIARSTCVSKKFKDIFDSDLVWEQVVPSTTAVVMGCAASGSRKFASKKKTFEFLCNPLLLESGTQGYWLDQRTGGVCYSLAARGLRVVWGDDDRYWSWVAGRGSRWPEVAYLEDVCWFHVTGDMKCLLPPGSYTLSWRLQYDGSQRQRGWASVPTEFTLSLSDGSQSTISHRYLGHHLGIAALQNGLVDLTPVRMVDDWLEYDAGEITVENEKEIVLNFGMMETHSGQWKSGVTLDGIVLRPTSIALSTGRRVTVEELGNTAVESARPLLLGIQPSRRQMGHRGLHRALRRDLVRVVHSDPPTEDAGLAGVLYLESPREGQ